VRLFVAVDPSEEARARLAEAVGRGSAIAPRARWVRPESLHVTLFFLGHVDDTRVGDVAGAVGRAARRSPPFPFSIGGVGTFGRPLRPKILWAGAPAGRAALVALQAAVSEELGALGFAAEEREFTPHLTLARAGHRDGDVDLAGARDDLAGFDAGVCEVREVVLYRSETPRGGAVYTALVRAALGGDG
jgi:2'-5' RNA ligase